MRSATSGHYFEARKTSGTSSGSENSRILPHKYDAYRLRDPMAFGFRPECRVPVNGDHRGISKAVRTPDVVQPGHLLRTGGD
jgi:hypothetical protein